MPGANSLFAAKEMIYLFIICFLPSLFRAWQDRKGQTKKWKLIHNAWVYGSFLLVVGIVSAIQRNVSLIFESAALLLLWRACLFDYVVHAFLNRFKEDWKKVNILTYTGESTYWWDQWIAKVDWRLRLIVRVVLFAAALVWFLIPM